MQQYRTIVTVADPKQIVLNNVPVQPGDRVEVIVRPEETGIPERMEQLLSETHDLPELKNISEEDIAAEIAASRNGQ